MSVTDWIQAFASVVAAFVAVAALAVAWLTRNAAQRQAEETAKQAVETANQVRIASEALAATRAADAAQQRDARVAGVRPLAIPEPGVPWFANDGVNRHQWVVSVLVPVDQDPVLDLRVILHGFLEKGDQWAAIATPGSLDPNRTHEVHVVVTPMLRVGEAMPKLPNGSDPHLLELQRYGPLGQWIVEEYEWDMGARALGSEPRRFRLRRFAIDHKVPGGEPFDHQFA